MEFIHECLVVLGIMLGYLFLSYVMVDCVHPAVVLDEGTMVVFTRLSIVVISTIV